MLDHDFVWSGWRRREATHALCSCHNFFIYNSTSVNSSKSRSALSKTRTVTEALDWTLSNMDVCDCNNTKQALAFYSVDKTGVGRI